MVLHPLTEQMWLVEHLSRNLIAFHFLLWFGIKANKKNYFRRMLTVGKFVQKKSKKKKYYVSILPINYTINYY